MQLASQSLRYPGAKCPGVRTPDRWAYLIWQAPTGNAGAASAWKELSPGRHPKSLESTRKIAVVTNESG